MRPKSSKSADWTSRPALPCSRHGLRLARLSSLLLLKRRKVALHNSTQLRRKFREVIPGGKRYERRRLAADVLIELRFLTESQYKKTCTPSILQGRREPAPTAALHHQLRLQGLQKLRVCCCHGWDESESVLLSHLTEQYIEPSCDDCKADGNRARSPSPVTRTIPIACEEQRLRRAAQR